MLKNPLATALAQKALSRPNATQREAPFIAIAGSLPPHKDLNEPPFLALLVLQSGAAAIWQHDGYLGFPIRGELLTLNLHKGHNIATGKGQVFVAMYGSGQTVEEAEQALKELMANEPI